MAQRRMLSRRISLSKKVNRLSLKAQLVYTWTIPYLDDFGCYTADPEDIKTEVFPKNNRISAKAIEIALAEARAGGLIKIYTVNGVVCQKYNNFNNFQTFQKDRSKKHAYPDYKDGLETDGIQCNPVCSLSKVKLSKEKIRENVLPRFFNNFWKPYPRKDAKQRAVEWFEKNNPSESDVEKMVYTIEQQKRSGQRLNCKRQFMPLPTTWLNDGDWQDAPTGVEIEEAKAKRAKEDARKEAQYDAVIKARQAIDRKAREQKEKEIREKDGPALRKISTEKLQEILDKRIAPLWITRGWLIKEILSERAKQ